MKPHSRAQHLITKASLAAVIVSSTLFSPFAFAQDYRAPTPRIGSAKAWNSNQYNAPMSSDNLGNQYYKYIDSESGGAIADFFVNASGASYINTGTVLTFVVDALPNSQVVVKFDSNNNFKREVSLQEVEPGRYSATYTVRRVDDLQRVNFTAFVTKNRKIYSAKLIAPSNPSPVSVAPSSPTIPVPAPVYSQAPVMNPDFGIVQSVNLTHRKTDKLNVPGTVIGAIAGGILGNQVGGGSGKTIASVLGAAGGGYVGNKIGQGQDEVNVWTAKILFEDGRIETFDYNADPQLFNGEKVVKTPQGLVRR